MHLPLFSQRLTRAAICGLLAAAALTPTAFADGELGVVGSVSSVSTLVPAPTAAAAPVAIPVAVPNV
jgi:hypothetical protein